MPTRPSLTRSILALVAILPGLGRAHAPEREPASVGGPGIRLVKDIVAGPGHGYPARFCRLGAKTLFSAIDGHGEELWSTDGTAAGTSLVRDIGPGDGMPLSWPFGPVPLGSFALFSAEDDDHGPELWRTDGTAQGTSLVEDIWPGPGPSIFTRDHVLLNGIAYFVAQDGATVNQVWRSDGTARGTYRLTSHTELPIFKGFPIVALGNEVVFSVGNSSTLNIWITDGTPGGTRRLRQFTPGLPDGTARAAVRQVGGAVFFAAADGQAGWELWKTDGTVSGTVRVKDVRPGALSSFPRNLQVFGNQLVFSADDGVHGEEPWITDGTDAGTRLLRDIAPGAASSSPGKQDREILAAGDHLFFSASDGVHGRELWRTDGTEAGTLLVRDVNPGAASGIVSDFAAFLEAGGELIFPADDGAHGQEAWRSDGTSEGTRMLGEIAPGVAGKIAESYLSGSTLLFNGGTPELGWELWAYDLPALSVSGSTGFESALSRRLVRFKVTLADADDAPVSVQYETVDGSAVAGSDYLAQSGTLGFPAGVTERLVYVAVLDDGASEGSESFSLRLHSSRHGVVRVPVAAGVIVDDEQP